MDEIVEIMALALHEEDRDGFGVSSWEALDDAQERGWYRDCARAALTALHNQGYAVVPVEPTEAMIDAGQEADTLYYSGRTQTEQIYRAMLKASPTDGASVDTAKVRHIKPPTDTGKEGA